MIHTFRQLAPPRAPSPGALLAGVLLALVAACGGGETEPRPAADAPLAGLDAPSELASDVPEDLVVPDGAPTVAFLGDSIGAGLHLAEHQAFPAVLQRRLVEAGLPFRLVSSCESGRTTAGGAAALDWVLRSEPAVVVIELGGNDGLRGIELEAVERNLRSMIEGAREAGARVVLLGVRLPPNYGEYATAFDALYPALAEEYELAFVPFFMQGVGGVPELNLPDGLHPTPAGQERLADNVQPTLEEVLRDLGAGDPHDR